MKFSVQLLKVPKTCPASMCIDQLTSHKKETESRKKKKDEKTIPRGNRNSGLCLILGILQNIQMRKHREH